MDQPNADLTRWQDPLPQLRQALAEDQFVLYCQPIRALAGASGYPLAEVLVRMREEEQALLPPGEFLPVFEHYGMMPQLDRWVVDHTLRKLAAGSKVPRFSVNVSAQTLEDAEFARFVAGAVRERAVPADRILFEIDEADALSQASLCARFAAQIKPIGCGIMLEGFGRRAVSFEPLKTVRADFIKIDGSITRRVLKSEAASKKMQAMVRVSDTLGIGTIAECVEDQDVLTRIRALGVGHAQGFGILEPRSIDVI